jgi:hypothetical protein
MSSFNVDFLQNITGESVNNSTAIVEYKTVECLENCNNYTVELIYNGITNTTPYVINATSSFTLSSLQLGANVSYTLQVIDIVESVTRASIVSTFNVPTETPTLPTEPTEPTNSTEPTGSTGPTEPTGSTGPTEPTEPGIPISAPIGLYAGVGAGTVILLVILVVVIVMVVIVVVVVVMKRRTKERSNPSSPSPPLVCDNVAYGDVPVIGTTHNVAYGHVMSHAAPPTNAPVYESIVS